MNQIDQWVSVSGVTAKIIDTESEDKLESVKILAVRVDEKGVPPLGESNAGSLLILDKNGTLTLSRLLQRLRNDGHSVKYELDVVLT